MIGNEGTGGFSFDEYYDEYPRIEEELNAALAVSLNPRNPDFLYEVVGGLGLPGGACVVDIGCGEGQYAIELARRFALTVVGVDPVPRHLELANDALAGEADEIRGRVRFVNGTAENLPFDDLSVDLIWCREVLYHVVSLEEALSECRRVLRPDGRMMIYQLFATGELESREAEWLWSRTGVVPRNADRYLFEQAISAARFKIDEDIELASETVEWAEEQNRKVSRELLYAARLRRDPERYINRFGRAAYEIKLADSLWHLYRMIGKLTQHLYVLSMTR